MELNWVRNKTIISRPIGKCCLIFLVQLILCANLYAATDEDEAPESDVGLSSESAPDEKQFEIPEVTFTVVDGEPVIDGKIDDLFWQQAVLFELELELYPTQYAPAVVETKAWIAANKTHIFVAFEASDPKPENIRSALRERDASKEDDYVSIIIDPTGTLAKKYEFRVNPHGTLSDVMQDTISDRYIYDWDTEWDAAAEINENGYSVEIAIPVGSIRSPTRFQDADHRGAIILKRSYPRRVDRTLGTFLLYSTRGEKAGEITAVPSQADETTAIASSDENIERQNKINYRPHYIYHLDEKRSIGGEYEKVDEHKLHAAGIDIDYHINSAQTLSFTLNPNYTDVEADIARQSINNPFVVFKPEKRRFFRSSTEYYNTLIPTVYTRNVIQPRWGISYIRDDVYSSFGAFGVNDKETEVIIPDTFGSDKVELLETSKSAAMRYRYSKNRRSFGLVGTLRTAEGYHNALAGIDGLWDIGLSDKLRYQVLYSDTEYPERFADDLCEQDDCTTIPPPEVCPLGNCSVNAQVLRTRFDETLNGYGLKIKYKHDSAGSLYWVGYDEFSPDFRADLGIQNTIDVRSLNMAYGRKWYVDASNDDQGKSRIRGYLVYTHSRSHEENDRVEDGVGLWAEFRGSYQSVARFGKRYRERAVNRTNQNSLATGSNAPLFSEDYWQWYLETSPWANWTLNLDGRWGEVANADNLVLGDMMEVKPKIAYRLDNWQFIVQTTYRDFDLDGSRLYKENFASFTILHRKSSQIGHRLLFLDDLTRRDLSRWMGDELAKEVEETLEYTFIYKPTKKTSLLAGIKAEYNFESDIDKGGITNRELYTKVEMQF